MVRTVRVSEYVRMKGKDHDWLIKGYIPKPAVILLTGEAKAGKTTIALQLAQALGKGGMFFNQQAKKCKVLFIQCDMSEFILRTVLQTYINCGVDLTGDVFLIHPEDMQFGMNVLQPDAQEYLRQARESCNPDVVFLDVLAELHSANEQDSMAMKEVITAILKIFYGLTVVIVHHNRKPPQPYGPNGMRPTVDPISASRGTSYLPGRADSVWMVDASPNGQNGTLHIKGRLGPQQQHPLRRLPSGLWALA